MRFEISSIGKPASSDGRQRLNQTRCVCAHRGRYDRDHACMHTRARHTYTIHDDTTGPEGGDCMLVDGGSDEAPRGIAPTPQLSQARPRTASTSLSLRPLHEGAATARWRSSKTRQTRIQFRHTPGEFGPTVYLRDLRDLLYISSTYALSALSSACNPIGRRPG